MNEPIIVPNQMSGPDFEERILIEASTSKLVMGVGAIFQDSGMNMAFQKCMEMGWIRFFDLVAVPQNPIKPPGPDNVAVPCRVFKITNNGQDRLLEIQRRKQIDKRLGKLQ